ncbi:MAG: hypothetical protein M0005_05850 [Actinomycetota bacterium]|nr:hypothetical protein [Actinomycetota bacterium]MDA8317226.1 hypothetical protein [Actinomycetota bacterium]
MSLLAPALRAGGGLMPAVTVDDLLALPEVTAPGPGAAERGWCR